MTVATSTVRSRLARIQMGRSGFKFKLEVQRLSKTSPVSVHLKVRLGLGTIMIELLLTLRLVGDSAAPDSEGEIITPVGVIELVLQVAP